MSPRTFRWRRGRPSGVCLNKFTVMKMRKEVKIGIFTVAILALLYWGINFLKGRDLFNRNMTYYAYYDNVSGIQMSSPIIVQGIRVGAVTGIKFRPDLNNTVEVKFDVKSAYRVPDNSVVRLFTNGIMGGKALEIELGDSPNALPDGATIRSESETSFLELAGSELDYFKQKLDQLISSLDLTLTSLNSILVDNSGSIAGTLEGLRRGAEAFGAKGEEIRSIIDDINEVTGALAANSERIDNTMANIENVSGALAEADLSQTVAKLNGAIDELTATLAAVNSTEGSIGLLMNDRALYDSLKPLLAARRPSEQSETLRAFLPVRGRQEQIAPPVGAVELRRSLFLSGRGAVGVYAVSAARRCTAGLSSFGWPWIEDNG